MTHEAQGRAPGPGPPEAVPGHGVRVAGEQAALQRIAMQVARAAPPEEVFAAVTEEVHRLLGTDITTMCRFNPDKTLTVVGVRVSAGIAFPVDVGLRGFLPGRNPIAMVFQTGCPARADDMDDDAAAPDLPPDSAQEALATAKAVAAGRAAGVRSVVAVPINVEGRLWGTMAVAAAHERRLPADTEQRLAGFTELVATAIANAEAREELRRAADCHAALRHVATLVARGEPPAAVFTAVAEEIAALFSADSAAVLRNEPDGQVTLLGGHGRVTIPEHHGWVTVTEQGPRGPLPAGTPATVCRETGRAARYDADDPVSGHMPLDGGDGI
jgi:GAF domain-containing protein